GGGRRRDRSGRRRPQLGDVGGRAAYVARRRRGPRLHGARRTRARGTRVLVRRPRAPPRAARRGQHRRPGSTHVSTGSGGTSGVGQGGAPLRARGGADVLFPITPGPAAVPPDGTPVAVATVVAP